MKNFKTHYPTQGTSALDANVIPEQRIIEFPSQYIDFPTQQKKTSLSVPRTTMRKTKAYFERTDTVQELRRKNISGIAFNQFKKWHVALSGSVLTVMAFVSIFFGV